METSELGLPLSDAFHIYSSNFSFSSAVLLGALNDRLLFANPTEINPGQKKGIEIKHCLVGLLEPLLIGFVTMQHHFEQKLDLSEVFYQITSRLSSSYMFFIVKHARLHFPTHSLFFLAPNF